MLWIQFEPHYLDLTCRFRSVRSSARVKSKLNQSSLISPLSFQFTSLIKKIRYKYKLFIMEIKTFRHTVVSTKFSNLLRFQPSFHASHSGLNQVFQPSNRVQLWFPESHWPTPSFPTFSKGSTMFSRITLASAKFSNLQRFQLCFPNILVV